MKTFLTKYLTVGRGGLNKTAQYFLGAGFFISIAAGSVVAMVK